MRIAFRGWTKWIGNIPGILLIGALPFFIGCPNSGELRPEDLPLEMREAIRHKTEETKALPRKGESESTGVPGTDNATNNPTRAVTATPNAATPGSTVTDARSAKLPTGSGDDSMDVISRREAAAQKLTEMGIRPVGKSAATSPTPTTPGSAEPGTVVPSPTSTDSASPAPASIYSPLPASSTSPKSKNAAGSSGDAAPEIDWNEMSQNDDMLVHSETSYLAELRVAAESGDSHSQYLWGLRLLQEAETGIGPAIQTSGIPEQLATKSDPPTSDDTTPATPDSTTPDSTTTAAPDAPSGNPAFSAPDRPGTPLSRAEINQLLVAADTEEDAWEELRSDAVATTARNTAIRKLAAEEAIRWFRSAADQGIAQAAYQLGLCAQRGIGMTPSADRAFDWYRQAARAGIANAQVELAFCYHAGTGCTKSASDAANWFFQAAKNGNVEAMVQYGLCCQEGIGVSVNATEAVKWFTTAASHESPDGTMELARCHELGEGVPQNMTTAIEYYEKAAALGHSGAQTRLGLCCALETGDKKDMKRAEHWFFLAAEQGDPEGLYYLALCYRDGQGVTRDEVETVRCFFLAANQNHAPAQVELARCFMKGFGTPQSTEEAMYWFNRAADLGNADARRTLENLRTTTESATTETPDDAPVSPPTTPESAS